jgi:penicillin-insensitive murein endopeptidase
MRRSILKKTLILLFSIPLIVACLPQLFHRNSGISVSHGNPGNGRLENGYLMDYSLENATYFSFTSYYLLGNGYLNSRVYKTLVEAYKACETSCPSYDFKIMECSSKKGGKQLVHNTHRNGLSVDFMVPKIKNNKQIKLYDHLGIWHYLLSFDAHGKLSFNQKVSIDFETIGKHIIALDDAAKQNGLRIKKVILKINLTDDFYKSNAGKEVKRRGIYFAKYLRPRVDNLHDDHYHIDFELI